MTEPVAPAVDTMADGIVSRQTYAVSLDRFEGPLDLLLHLVRRHELDVLDIPIAFVTEKYLEYLEFARALDLEIAGEYLVMAATLAYLKSRELLPPDPNEELGDAEDEDLGIDPREELIRRLIEYERYRSAGEELGQRPVTGRDVFPRGGDLAVKPLAAELAPVTLFRLADAYNRVLDRAQIRKDHEVILERVTVRQRIGQLGLMLDQTPSVDFEQIFLSRVWHSEAELRSMLVVTLMSVLEMVKLGLLSVHQPDGSTAIVLERAVDRDALRSAIETYAGNEYDEPDEAEPSDPAPEPDQAAEHTPATDSDEA